MRTTIRWFCPYSQGWKFQGFNTYNEAERMVDFYIRAGTIASIMTY
jgi:hypothetical protein